MRISLSKSFDVTGDFTGAIGKGWRHSSRGASRFLDENNDISIKSKFYLGIGEKVAVSPFPEMREGQLEKISGTQKSEISGQFENLGRSCFEKKWIQ
jgi:hypothetical protein